jgi:peptidylprolyl isomerase
MARTAANGDTVRIHYTGKLDDDSVFDTSAGGEPLEFEVGSGQVIVGFDNAVRGMAVGQCKTVIIPAGEAYGPPHEELVLTVARDSFPDGLSPEPGMELQLENEGGQTLNGVVRAVTDKDVTVDANHPLAGQDLTFELELVAIA